MPAEKGIPKPEASARRLDVRNYDSREAWGWLSEDERLIMSKEGVAYVDVGWCVSSLMSFSRSTIFPFTRLTASDFFAGCDTSETTGRVEYG